MSMANEKIDHDEVDVGFEADVKRGMAMRNCLNQVWDAHALEMVDLSCARGTISSLRATFECVALGK